MSNTNAVGAAIATKVNQLYGSGTRTSFAFAATTPPGTVAATGVPPEQGVLLQLTRPTGAPPRQAQQVAADLVSIAPSTLAAKAAAAAAPKATGTTVQAITSTLSNTRISAPTPGISNPSTGDAFNFQVTGGPGAGQYYDWTARIRSKKNELQSGYSVLIFLGTVPQNAAQWRSSTSYVGAHHIFANSVSGQCANCTQNADLVVEGFVHLNEAIAGRSGLHSFSPEVVEPYLKQNLHWRVQKVTLAFRACSSTQN